MRLVVSVVALDLRRALCQADLQGGGCLLEPLEDAIASSSLIRTPRPVTLMRTHHPDLPLRDSHLEVLERLLGYPELVRRPGDRPGW